MHFCIADHIIECADHELFELLVNHGFFPEITLAVLHPLEIGSCDATGVAEDVWNDKDAFASKNLVGCGGGGAVGAFGQDAALYTVGVAAGDLIFGGSGYENFALG